MSEKLYPLASSQKGLWWHDQISGNTAMYNMPCLLKSNQMIDLDHLRLSLQKLLSLYPILAINVQYNDQGPEQVVKHQNISINTVDLTDLSEEDATKKIYQLHQRLLERPFDVTCDVLIRAECYISVNNTYFLGLSIHHLVADGWSIGILLQTLNKLYCSQTSDNTSIPITPTFFEFNHWQMNQQHREAMIYWQKTLNQTHNPVTIPYDYDHHPHAIQGDRVQIKFSPHEMNSLDTWCKKNAYTPYTLFMLSFRILLSLYSQEETTIIGSPFSNRHHPQFQKTVGLLVNTLALKNTIKKTQTLHDLLQQEQQAILQGMKYQALPFEQLISQLDLIRSDHDIPLFKTVVVMQNFLSFTQTSPFALVSSPAHTACAKFDVLLSITKTSSEMYGFIEYKTDRYHRQTMLSLVQQLKFVIAFILGSHLKKTTLQSMTLPSEKPKKRSLPSSNQESFCKKLYQSCLLHQKNIAIVCTLSHQSYTYEQLLGYSNRLVNQFQTYQLTQGDIVGLILPYQLEMIASILALLRMGVTYTPLDATWPQQRLNQIAKDANFNYLITTSSDISLHSIPTIIPLNIAYEELNESLADVHPDTIAYVIYTSGTTGVPKGVQIPQKALTSLFLSTDTLFQFNTHDIIPMTHAYTFDFSVWEMFSALLYGARLLLIPSHTRHSLIELFHCLEQNNITILNQTPSSFHALLDLWQEKPQALENLRHIIFGGETLHCSDLKRWYDTHDRHNVQLTNMYGITETTVHNTYYIIQPEKVTMSQAMIGKPLLDTTLYIMDEKQCILPKGMFGEIYVGGHGLAHGYLNQADLTKEKFIEHPTLQCRLYRTGDFGRCRQDGSFEYLGRKDSQMKIRGYRVELNAINTVIRKHSAIQQSHIMCLENQQIIAYCVPTCLPTKERDNTNIQENWQHVFNTLYQNQSPSHALFNTIGWNNSYNNQAIAQHEMKQWQHATVQRILDYQPKNILEIGCGTGLLLTQLAPHCSSYHGIDPAKQAIDYITHTVLEHLDKSSHIVVEHLRAEHFTSDRKYDCIIINSVIQYFPQLTYLEQLLKRLIKYATPDATFFLGDIRNLQSQTSFYFDVAKYKHTSHASLNQLHHHMDTAMLHEQELFIHPHFFHDFVSKNEQTAWANIYHKIEPTCNEMSLFRYDVIIKLGNKTPPIKPDLTINGEACLLTHTYLKTLLQKTAQQRQSVLVKHIPHRYTYPISTETKYFMQQNNNDTIEIFQKKIEKLVHPDLFLPDECLTWVKQHHLFGYVYFNDSEKIGYFDLLVLPNPGYLNQFPYHTPKGVRHSNLPNKHEQIDLLTQSLKEHITKSLPAYMHPHHLFFVDELPRNAHGKVNENRLRRPMTHTKKKHPPKTETEHFVAKLFSELLQQPIIGRNDRFFTCGGHSLLAVKLMLKINQYTQNTIPLAELLKHDSVKDIAHLIDHQSINTQIDLSQCYQAIINKRMPLSPLPKQSHDGMHILLTGATGFVGIYLLYELLNQSEATIYCLIRGKTLEDAEHKLQQQFDQYHINCLASNTSINIILGDLSQPLFGLKKSTYNQLAHQIDCVIHAGAHVNFAYPYHALAPTNVHGTESIIQFSHRHRLKSIHYISSLYILTDQDRPSLPIHEETLPNHGELLSTGYLQSKWVAEKLMLSARTPSNSITIYRLGRMSGDTSHYHSPQNDFFWRLTRLSVSINAVPNLTMPINLTPIDIACQHMVQLILDKNMHNKQYHIQNKHTMTFQKYYNVLQSMYPNIEQIPMKTWINLVEEKSHELDPIDSALLPVLTHQNQHNAVYCNQATLTHPYCSYYPSLEDELMLKYLKNLQAIGFLPQMLEVSEDAVR